MDSYNQTEIHPAALMLTLAMGIWMLACKRHQMALPFLIVACFITHAQRVVLFGMDFSMLRVLILFGWVRIVARGETSLFRRQPVDFAFVIWLALGTLSYVFGPRATPGALVTRMGTLFDGLGIYFLFRVLLADLRDVRAVFMSMTWVSLGMVGPMILENLTGRNLFHLLGGVAEYTRIRDGRIRCQGSFSHPIMAGSFGATAVAMSAALWLIFPKERVLHGAGVIAALAVVVLSTSGGALLAVVAGGIGWASWLVRPWLNPIRLGMVAGVFVVHFVREQPVWHLLGRVSSIVGGTGWHRYRLIDQAIEHFDEWWWLGTWSTSHWKMRQASDVTNQYILEGVRGGLATMLSLIAVLVVAFRTVGRSVRFALGRVPSRGRMAQAGALLAWGAGVVLFVDAVAFMGVSYFGQLSSILYLHLALAPSIHCALQRSLASSETTTPEASYATTEEPAV